jgi:hypothetical protein
LDICSVEENLELTLAAGKFKMPIMTILCPAFFALHWPLCIRRATIVALHWLLGSGYSATVARQWLLGNG